MAQRGRRHPLRAGLVLAALLCACAPAALAQTPCGPQRTITLAVDMQQQSPLHEPILELYENIFARVGWCVRFKTASFARSMEGVRSGLLDGDFFRVPAYEQAVPGAVMVEEPMGEIGYALYVKDDRFRTITSRDDLLSWPEPLRVGYTGGVISGLETLRLIQERTRHRLFNITEQERGVRMLRQGRLDVFLGTDMPVDTFLLSKEMRGSGISKRAVFVRYYGYIFLNERYAALAPLLREAARQAKEDGTYRRIIGIDPPPSALPGEPPPDARDAQAP
jgi:ABC-type amino acid transport substrate-binding protein